MWLLWRIRGLVDKIVVSPIEGTKELSADLYGDLAGILGMASGKAKPLNEIEEMADQVKMVAGECDKLSPEKAKLVACSTCDRNYALKRPSNPDILKIKPFMMEATFRPWFKSCFGN